MHKKYVVRLTATEREALNDFVKKLKGSSQKVRRAQVLRKADAEIADAYGCRTQTVENIRERFVTEGFELAIEGKPKAPRPKVLSGEQEAKIIAMRLGPPPEGNPVGG